MCKGGPTHRCICLATACLAYWVWVQNASQSCWFFNQLYNIGVCILGKGDAVEFQYSYRICCDGREPQGLSSRTPGPAHGSLKSRTLCTTQVVSPPNAPLPSRPASRAPGPAHSQLRAAPGQRRQQLGQRARTAPQAPPAAPHGPLSPGPGRAGRVPPRPGGALPRGGPAHHGDDVDDGSDGDARAAPARQPKRRPAPGPAAGRERTRRARPARRRTRKPLRWRRGTVATSPLRAGLPGPGQGSRGCAGRGCARPCILQGSASWELRWVMVQPAREIEEEGDAFGRLSVTGRDCSVNSEGAGSPAGRVWWSR